MAVHNNFVKTIDELINSAEEFYFKPEFWKAVLGSSPKYFIHYTLNGNDVFGLSKFCAFKNIKVENYLKEYRYMTGGGTTQKHISKLTGKKWKMITEVDKKIGISFTNWISQFFPNYNLENASFISLTKSEVRIIKRKKAIKPEDLIHRLKFQQEIGKAGEEIAFLFEIQRLKEKQVKNPERFIDHVSKRNASAGYDIYSSIKDETRYIEVKSSLTSNLDFFLTENEITTLDFFGEEAFLYFVHITDLITKKGYVSKIINDPMRQIIETGEMRPILYKVEINDNKNSS